MSNIISIRNTIAELEAQARDLEWTALEAQDMGDDSFAFRLLAREDGVLAQIEQLERALKAETELNAQALAYEAEEARLLGLRVRA